MGKYNLGKSTTKMGTKLTKEDIYLNEVKADPIIKNILKELDGVSASLQNINILLNRSVKVAGIKGNKAITFKSWARKSKAQANNALKIKDKVTTKYNKDVKDYPIKLLDDRIAELEKKIAILSK